MIFFLQNPPLAEPKYIVQKLEAGGMIGEIWNSLSRELNYTWVILTRYRYCSSLLLLIHSGLKTTEDGISLNVKDTQN
jgi:hypothetical protein